MRKADVQALSAMMDWCRSNGVEYFCELMDYASKHERGWFRALCDGGTPVMCAFLEGRKWSRAWA